MFRQSPSQYSDAAQGPFLPGVGDASSGYESVPGFDPEQQYHQQQQQHHSHQQQQQQQRTPSEPYRISSVSGLPPHQGEVDFWSEPAKAGLSSVSCLLEMPNTTGPFRDLGIGRPQVPTPLCSANMRRPPWNPDHLEKPSSVDAYSTLSQGNGLPTFHDINLAHESPSIGGSWEDRSSGVPDADLSRGDVGPDPEVIPRLGCRWEAREAFEPGSPPSTDPVSVHRSATKRPNTVMIRNLGCRCTADLLMKHLDAAGLAGTYESVYIPARTARGRHSTNFGYGFVTFRNPGDVDRCHAQLNGQPLRFLNTVRKVEVVLAHVQGVAGPSRAATATRQEVATAPAAGRFLWQTANNELPDLHMPGPLGLDSPEVPPFVGGTSYHF